MLLRTIDDFLNGITMYRLLLYGLSVLALICIVLSFAGVLSAKPASLLLTLGIIFTAGFLANHILQRIWRVAANFESGMITCLILFFILPQATSNAQVLGITAVTAAAIASKFIIAPRRAHIFNPAAFGAASIALLIVAVTPIWWVGSSVLWPFTLLLGLLVVRKLRRFSMLAAFVLVSLATTAVLAITDGFSAADNLRLAVTASPLIFLGTIMLTEPSTTPGRRRQQVIYGGIVGLLFSAQLLIGKYYISPEIALLLGNIYAYAVSRKQHVRLRLKEVRDISPRIRDYIFAPDKPLNSKPGQYMEWTLPMLLPDGRGNRRTFSIASSPTESDIHLGVKFYDPSSKFKRDLRDMKPGDSLIAGQVGGDFVMPDDKDIKLAFIAGGIGITPFRSMLQHLIDSGQKRDIVLLYLVASSDELAYREVIEKAATLGVRTVPVIAAGPLDKESISKHVPDYASRQFYISGPQGLVGDIRQVLLGLGVRRKAIKTDYFSGY